MVFDEINLSYDKWHYKLKTNDEFLKDKIKLLFRHFYTEAHSLNDNRVINIEKNNDEYIITNNNKIQEPVSNYSDVIGKIIEEILYPTLFDNQNYLYLHGGAVAKDNIGICYLAPSNIGKTTLTIDFIKQGYSYLTDDIIPIKLSDFTTKGFPKPLFLRLDSIHEPNCGIYIKSGEYERNVYIPMDYCRHPVKVKYIFILNRDSSNKDVCDIQEMERSNKFMTILNNVYYTPDKIHMIKSISELIRTVKLYNIYYNTSDQAIKCIKSVLEYV